MPAWVRCGRLLAAALGLAASGTAAARPLTVEDVLAREAIGRVALSDRWAIAEVRRPYETAWRFDLDMRTDALRTGIEVSDLRRPTPLRPLFPAEPGVGYALGPIAPDGERIIVFRLKGDAWELGVAEIASSQVRWLDVAPELTATGEAAAWIGRDAVAVITAPNEFGSFDLRLRRYPALLSARRAVTAAGGVSATAIGSGRHLSMTPAAPPNQLLRFDLSAGSLRTLATGRFTDLEVSPSGRWIAAFRSGAIIPLDPARPVQGAQGIEMRRTRLSLIDATTGAETAIAPERDMLGQLLRWSPEADELLVFGRRDGESWADGRLLRVTPRGGARPLATPGFRPIVLGRPGVVHAGWLGGAPVVYGEAAVEGSSPRRDWFLLRRGARNLTGFLARAPRPDPTIIADGALWLPQPGGLWRIDDKGARRAIQDETAALAVAAIPGLKRRQDQAPYIDHPVVGVSATGPERQLLWPGGSPPAPMPADARILAVGAAGVLVTAWRSDAGEEVAWIARSRTVTALKRINAHLASVDALRVAPVRHARPGGGTLTSWLVLPQGRAARPPPLVVWPYPGSVYPSFPAYMQVLTGGELETPALLAGRGYAVLVPSLPLDHAQAGPAAGLAQQVLDIIDAARGDPALRDAFDPQRLAVWGASFGGYGAIAMLTQTDRFAAAVVQGAPSSLLSMHGDFGLRRLALPEAGLGSAPSAGWTEDLQGDMRGPPWTAVDRYVRNSPVLQADKIKTPLLIVHGELDTIPIGEAQQLFSSLFRQNKDAVLVTYWGEEHRLTSPGTIRDYYRRAFDWLDSHLKPAPIAVGDAPPAPGPGPRPASAAPRTPPWRRPSLGRRRRAR